MAQRIRWLLLSSALALILTGSVLILPNLVYGQPDPEPAEERVGSGDKLDGALLNAISGSQPETPLRFIIFFADKADLSPDTLPKSDAARRREIVSRLQETSDASQVAVQRELATLQETGQVSAYRQLWIVNGIAVEGTAAAAAKLTGHPDVDHITLDEGHRYFDPPYTLDGQTSAASAAASWGIERIRADKVWAYLGITGAGSTVAIMDSGVSWQHPDLVGNYRGNIGNGEVEHEKNWFHAINISSTEPYDEHGHGTHVTGTAVGQNGIGVAPGAKWIAVAIADKYGIIYDSSIHAGFQWLLAPGGDSAAAPDVVNNSWGGAGTKTDFVEDINILHAAGIITLFAAGNSGPDPGTVLAPASYTETLAIGASDSSDQPAWFSGRGPSPLTVKNKPLLLAPGTQIRSTLPGSTYSSRSGTSMAAPHVAGTVALILSADPALDLPQVRDILTSTAIPVAAAHPNKESGWGRLDAYTAVLSRLPHGRLFGITTHNGLPRSDVQLLLTKPDGFELTTYSDAAGRYDLLLPPGSYTMQITAFGFHDQKLAGITIAAGQELSLNVTLQQRPMGLLSGMVTDKNGKSLTAAITLLDTPKEIETEADGHFSFWFPTGSYEMLVQATGYRLRRIPLKIETNKELRLDLALEDGPSILLLDSGPIRFDSARASFQDALTAGGYSSDLWSIDQPTSPLPTVVELAPYDMLIWSAPSNSPGQLSANDVLTDYLGAGGNLLISGQDVASLDGQPGFELPWFRSQLDGQFITETETAGETLPLTGAADSPFAGLAPLLNGDQSAGSQVSPDQVAPRKESLTTPIFHYADGGVAGLQAGYCGPFRIVQLGFGLEGVDGAENRAAVMQRSIDALLAPRTPRGVRWLPDQQQEIVLPGEQYIYQLNVQNMGELMAGTFDLRVEPYAWATSLLTPTLELEPCGVGQTQLTVTVPPDAEMDKSRELRLTAVSRADASIKATFVMQQKTPGDLLLVDDDRFFEREDVYKEALDNLGYTYDVWDTTPDGQERGGPPAGFLQAYKTVIWFTGYDWFAPIRPEENEDLTTYLAGGGHLFLSSQDYLFYNWNTPLTREHLGVVDYREVVTPTALFANPDLALPGSLAGPVPLSYKPYQNFSDGIIPQTGSEPFLWTDQGLVGAVTHAGAAGGRALFLSLPFETLPAKERLAALDGIMGWLGDLGDSTFAVDSRFSQAGEARTYTLTLRSLPHAPAVTVAISNTLPEGMALLPGTLDDSIHISPAGRTLSWQGVLPPGAEKQISYQATTPEYLPAGTKLENKLTIRNLTDNSSWRKALPLWIDSPDLSQSSLSSWTTTDLPQRTVTYTLALRNSALFAAGELTAVLHLPDMLHVLTGTLHTSAGEAALFEQQLLWRGALEGGGAVTTTVVLTQAALSEAWLPAAAIIGDGLRDPIILNDLRYSPPEQSFFPFLTFP